MGYNPSELRYLRKGIVWVSRAVRGIDPRKVVFSCFQGRNYGDNPRYISERLHERCPEAKIVWLFRPDTMAKVRDRLPDYVVPVSMKSFRAYAELATARVWVDNYTKNNLLTWDPKKQFYIQTWHGDRGFKRVGFDDEKCFGPKSVRMNWAHGKEEPIVSYEEAPWVMKRNGTYYLSYAAGGVPEHMAYSTAPTINGPWTYRGKIMDTPHNSFTIHGGNIEFKGRSYMFYHNGKLPNGGGYKRATCIEEFTPNEDGTIPHINFTTKGVEPLQTLNPFVLQEAETINQCQGVLCEGDYTGCYVTNISPGDYIKVRNVDFGTAGAKSFKARIKANGKATLIIRTGSKSGTIKGRLTLESTNGEWTDVTCDLTQSITGVQNLFFTFAGSGQSLFDFDNWQFFEAPTAIHELHHHKTTNKNAYNLRGNRIDSESSHHGIKIVNGKKISL